MFQSFNIIIETLQVINYYIGRSFVVPMNNSNLSYFRLIRLIRSGDHEAFGVLFNHFYAPLCSYALSILKYPETAQEVVQETFIRLWENRQQLSIETSIRAYLYRSVHNNCITYVRSLAVSSRRNKALTDEIKYHFELATNNLEGEALESIISGELETFLEEKVKELPDQCKRIFCFSRFDQLSYQDIANKLGISVNTVKTQLSRAFYKLHEAYMKFEKI